MSRDNEPAELDERTRIPIVWLLAGLSTAIGIAGFAGFKANEILNRLDKLETRFVVETWDRSDMSDWSRELQIRNQGITVPVVNAKPK